MLSLLVGWFRSTPGLLTLESSAIQVCFCTEGARYIFTYIFMCRKLGLLIEPHLINFNRRSLRKKSYTSHTYKTTLFEIGKLVVIWVQAFYV